MIISMITYMIISMKNVYDNIYDYMSMYENKRR